MRSKEERAAYNKAYHATPEAKAARRIRDATPEARAAQKARNATPAVKACQKAYNATPEAKAKQKEYKATPEAKAKQNASQRRRNGLPNPTRPAPARCEGCGENKKLLRLDHCHVTGQFRGWLCNQCNLGLGSLGDTIAGLQKMIDYLNRASCQLSISRS
jgi:hypothetical protein